MTTPWHSFDMALAEREIERQYGDIVSVWDKAKTILKFGRNAGVGTSYETIWEFGGDETLVADNLITHASSSSTSDTATIMYVEGHTVSGTGADSKFRFVSENIALNGQNKVAFSRPFARTSRAYVLSGSLAGDFYVFEDDTLTGGVPDTASKVHLTVEGATSGHTQSFKAATTFSDADYAIITGGTVAINKKTAATADFLMEAARPGEPFRPVGGRVTANTAGLSTAAFKFEPFVIVPKNSDIRIRAIASTTSVEVDGWFQCYLASVR